MTCIGKDPDRLVTKAQKRRLELYALRPRIWRPDKRGDLRFTRDGTVYRVTTRGWRKVGAFDPAEKIDPQRFGMAA